MKIESDRSLVPRLTTDQAWKRLSVKAMTSMVLSLDFIKILGEVILKHFEVWNLCHFSTFFKCLEACYDHARCFNVSTNLKERLKDRNFMNFHDSEVRLPHLLEQEASAATQILTISFRLYSKETSNSKYREIALFVEPLIKR